MKWSGTYLQLGMFALLTLVAHPASANERSTIACPSFGWTTLGTAGGPVPTADRAEPSNLLKVGDRLILVDAGDGTVNQLARLGVSLGVVDSVFISHHHHDHTGGLAAVIGLRWMNSYAGRLTVYGPPGTAEIVRGIIASLQPQARIGFGVGAEIVPPEATVRVVELADGETVTSGNLRVTAAANTHFDHAGQPDAHALSFSYRFDYGSRSITYSGDTGPSQALARLAAGSDLLVTEIMELDGLIAAVQRQRPDMPPVLRSQIEQHLREHHLTAEAVGELARDAHVSQILLTHYSISPSPLAASADALMEGIRHNYSGSVQFGIDLGSINVGCGGM